MIDAIAWLRLTHEIEKQLPLLFLGGIEPKNHASKHFPYVTSLVLLNGSVKYARRNAHICHVESLRHDEPKLVTSQQLWRVCLECRRHIQPLNTEGLIHVFLKEVPKLLALRNCEAVFALELADQVPVVGHAILQQRKRVQIL